jgi:integrase
MSMFTSAFAPKTEAFLEFRVARGFNRNTHHPNLLRFDGFCSEHHAKSGQLTPDVVYGRLDAEGEENPRALGERASTIRQFGMYLSATGEDAYVIPEKYNTNQRAHIPYNFTDAELTALFKAIDRLPEDKREPFLHEIAPVLFRLAYTCGLRPNESRDILCENINLKTGAIQIINTKKNKDRLVVMSDDMRKMCVSYDSKRVIFANGSPYFFPSASGEAFLAEKIQTTLKKAWATAICSKNCPVPPNIRVYDFRHRFVSARLNLWLDEKRDLMSMLPYLREYLGHKTLNETEYYVHILPENLSKSPAIDWDKFNAMFPEVPA